MDGLRALSIILVVVSHARGTVGFPRALTDERFYDGVLGVDVFFVVSGFLITSLLLDEEDRLGRIDLRSFYVRRALRILPAALAYVGVIAAVDRLVSPVAPASDLLACVFFCRNLFGDSGVTAHFWSLSVEEQFYLVWPALFLLLPAGRRLRVAVVLFALAPLWRVANLSLLHAAALNAGRADLHYDTLAAGVILALMRRDAAGQRTYALARANGAKLVTLGVAALFAMHAAWRGKITPWSLTFRNVALAAIVLAVVTDPGAITRALLDAPPLRFLGRISYSLYLWQQFVLFRPPATALTSFPVNLAVALALACASYFLIERPILSWRDRRCIRGSSFSTLVPFQAPEPRV